MTTERRDPQPPDWASVSLPETWADQLRFYTPGGLTRLGRALFGKARPVQVDRSHPLLASIPRYALQEFHNLPNGNYSRTLSRGYVTGFDISMLGHINRLRRKMAQRVAHCRSVLDLGTSGGKLAAEVKTAGVADVWGVDVCPYLLQHGAESYPDIRFVQAPAEDLPFADGRFEAIVVCFLFHEMPPKYVRRALGECHRLLAEGGRLLVAEPSDQQLQPLSWRRLFSATGWRHAYFRFLARFVREPFVEAWHRLDKPALFREAGFRVEKHRDELPVNYFSLIKQTGE